MRLPRDPFTTTTSPPLTAAISSPATASEFSLLGASNATGNFTKVAQRLPIRITIDPGQELSEYLEPGLSVVVTVEEGSGAAGKSAAIGAPVMGGLGG